MKKYRQLLTSIVFFALGILWIGLDSTILATIHFLAAALFAFGYFWLGPVIVAYGQATRGNFISAAETLDTVGDPNKLTGRQRAYYFLTRGLVDESNNRLTSAEQFLNKARCEPSLPPKEDASIYLALARIYLLQGRDGEAAAQVERVDLSRVGASLRSQAEAVASAIDLRSNGDRLRKSLFSDDDAQSPQA